MQCSHFSNMTRFCILHKSESRCWPLANAFARQHVLDLLHLMTSDCETMSVMVPSLLKIATRCTTDRSRSPPCIALHHSTQPAWHLSHVMTLKSMRTKGTETHRRA